MKNQYKCKHNKNVFALFLCFSVEVHIVTSDDTYVYTLKSPLLQ